MFLTGFFYIFSDFLHSICVLPSDKLIRLQHILSSFLCLWNYGLEEYMSSLYSRPNKGPAEEPISKLWLLQLLFIIFVEVITVIVLNDLEPCAQF